MPPLAGARPDLLHWIRSALDVLVPRTIAIAAANTAGAPDLAYLTMGEWAVCVVALLYPWWALRRAAATSRPARVMLLRGRNTWPAPIQIAQA